VLSVQSIIICSSVSSIIAQSVLENNLEDAAIDDLDDKYDKNKKIISKQTLKGH